jgi:hypothetical protein
MERRLRCDKTEELKEVEWQPSTRKSESELMGASLVTDTKRQARPCHEVWKSPAHSDDDSPTQ